MSNVLHKRSGHYSFSLEAVAAATPSTSGNNATQLQIAIDVYDVCTSDYQNGPKVGCSYFYSAGLGLNPQSTFFIFIFRLFP